MRAPVLLVSALTASAFGATNAQCSPGTQKLLTDQKYDQARAEVQASIKKNESDDVALHCMGMIYVAMDKSGDAIEWFERAIKANDKVSAHHLWLANALGDQAQHTSKLKLPFLARRIKGEFDKAAQLDPSSIDAHHGLIQFYSQAPGVMGGSMDKARDEAREIGKLNAMRGHFEMAQLYGREKNAASAEQELKAAMAAAPPDSLIAAYTLAGFYVNEKKWAEAFAIYDRVLKEKPAELTPHFQYGRTSALSGENMERGERELKYWLANASREWTTASEAGAHHRLGMIYERQGRKDAARTEYQAAVTINPKNADAKKALDGLK